MIFLYTDGSVTRPKLKKSPGGWAYCFRIGDKVHSSSGGVMDVTNNQMEIVAAIKGFQALLDMGLEGESVCVVSDSQYVVNGGREWVKSWKRNHWRNSRGQAIKNRKFWSQIDMLAAEFTTRWKWVRGHNGHPDNEFVDKLARKAAFRAAVIEDTLKGTEDT